MLLKIIFIKIKFLIIFFMLKMLKIKLKEPKYISFEAREEFDLSYPKCYITKYQTIFRPCDTKSLKLKKIRTIRIVVYVIK